jgi:D-mannonate dehydratase (UxuA)
MDDEPAQPTDMLECMRAYHETGFDGPMRPDHVPALAGESNESYGYATLGRLFAVGYITGQRDEGGHQRFHKKRLGPPDGGCPHDKSGYKRNVPGVMSPGARQHGNRVGAALSGRTPDARVLPARSRDPQTPAPLPHPAHSYCMGAAFMQLCSHFRFR